MTLVLHLIRWDVRRFQILLSLWLLLVAASALLEGAWPAIAVAMASRQTAGITGNLLALAEVLFSLVLITLVVQEHSLVGTKAFWMTRPIPPLSLLAAKVILLSAVAIAAPVLAEIVLMIAYDVPASDIGAVAAQSSFFWALWLGIVIALAALTPNMAKFALAIGGVIITMIVSIVTIAAIALDRFRDSPPIPTAGEMYDPTRGVVSTILMIGSVIAFLVVLYRRRARPRALALGLACFAVAWVAGSAWPWPWLVPSVETPAWALGPSGLQLSVSAGAVNFGATIEDFGGSQADWRVARTAMRLKGVAPGWSAGVGLRETSIRVEGREEVTSHVRAAPASVAIDDAESVQHNEVIRRLLNVRRLIDWRQQTKPETAVVMVARTAELRELAVASGAYEGTFRVSLTHHQIEAVLPFRIGAATQIGAHQFTLDRIRLQPSRISVLARESDAVSIFDRHPVRRVDYYLRNVQTSEAVQGSYRELRSDVTLARFLPFAVGVGESEGPGFRPVALEVNFSTGYGGPEEIVFDNTWLERSELVIVRSTEQGAVERRLAIADFPLRLD